MLKGLTRQRPGELPLEVTGFVGRQRELAELGGLLRSARLVTVTGPGGVGKTRVALRAAAQLSGEFADGTCLVELSGLHDPELLPDTIATCLGLPGTEPRSQLDAIIEHLRDQRMLLILDTCEHLVDACAMLADVLLRATIVTVLATSRQPLAVPGEHTCAIAPLPVPDRRARTAGDGDAVELFAQCAVAVVPGFAVTDANRDCVIRLCRRLDGVPLAIELATRRLRAIPLEQLADRLEDRFRLLTGGRRAALPHHHSRPVLNSRHCRTGTSRGTWPWPRPWPTTPPPRTSSPATASCGPSRPTCGPRRTTRSPSPAVSGTRPGWRTHSRCTGRWPARRARAGSGWAG
jgi:hypothetical protein